MKTSTITRTKDTRLVILILLTLILLLSPPFCAIAQDANAGSQGGIRRLLIGHYYCSGPPGVAYVSFDGILGPRLSPGTQSGDVTKLNCTSPYVEDCHELAEAVKKRTVARGCKASPIDQNDPSFQFVCTGVHDDLIDVINALCQRIIMPLPSGAKEEAQ
jgi:hypothetical protein